MATDRYELLERVDLALVDLMETVNPAWGPEWCYAALALMIIGDQLARARNIFRTESVRRDPRRPDWYIADAPGSPRGSPSGNGGGPPPGG